MGGVLLGAVAIHGDGLGVVGLGVGGAEEG